jgi:uncharacterized protein YciI
MFRTTALIAVVTLVGGGAAAQQQPKIDEYKMVTYQAVLVTKGPAWSPETAAVMPLVRAHREYVSGLMRSGRLHIAGSFAGESPLRCVYILSGTPDEARALAEADPGVKEGRYGIEVLQWMGPEGWFRRPADGAKTETIYFGFLVTGDTTAALAPEAQQALMRGHLDHMDGQAKQGRLVLAGPLVKAGTRRGLIAYRVPTMAEAVERASADPMVKAGRMKPELYEWTIPAGVLK